MVTLFAFSFYILFHYLSFLGNMLRDSKFSIHRKQMNNPLYLSIREHIIFWSKYLSDFIYICFDEHIFSDLRISGLNKLVKISFTKSILVVFMRMSISIRFCITPFFLIVVICQTSINSFTSLR